MNDVIVRHPRGVTLLGGGEAQRADLDEALAHAPCLVAADGGAAFALESGVTPEAVIGDMDSLPPAVRDALPPERVYPISDQDSTDFDKALRSVATQLVLGVGFLGGRVDHQLANFNVLVRRAAQPCILIGSEDIVLAAPPRLSLEIGPGSRVSLFPLVRVSGASRGLHWPIDGVDFSPDGATGTSNRVARDHSGALELAFDRPGMLLILPRAALSAAIAGLAAVPSAVRAR